MHWDGRYINAFGCNVESMHLDAIHKRIQMQCTKSAFGCTAAPSKVSQLAKTRPIMINRDSSPLQPLADCAALWVRTPVAAAGDGADTARLGLGRPGPRPGIMGWSPTLDEAAV